VTREEARACSPDTDLHEPDAARWAGSGLSIPALLLGRGFGAPALITRRYAYSYPNRSATYPEHAGKAPAAPTRQRQAGSSALARTGVGIPNAFATRPAEHLCLLTSVLLRPVDQPRSRARIGPNSFAWPSFRHGPVMRFKSTTTLLHRAGGSAHKAEQARGPSPGETGWHMGAAVRPAHSASSIKHPHSSVSSSTHNNHPLAKKRQAPTAAASGHSVNHRWHLARRTPTLRPSVTSATLKPHLQAG